MDRANERHHESVERRLGKRPGRYLRGRLQRNGRPLHRQRNVDRPCVGNDGDWPQPIGVSGDVIHSGMWTPDVLMWAIMQDDSASEQAWLHEPAFHWGARPIEPLKVKLLPF